MAILSISVFPAGLLAASLLLGVVFAQSVPVPIIKPAATLDPIQHGAALFAETGCAHCHGSSGSGGDRGPDLKNVSRRMTVRAMTTQIHDGGQSMPPFGEELKDQEIVDLVAYLRAKHKPLPPAKPKEAELPPAPTPPPNAK